MSALAIEYEWGKSHYANRKARAAKHIRGCRQKGDPTCGGAFKCTECELLVGWCRGGHEESPRDEWCDTCWCKDDRKRERSGVGYDAHLARLRVTTQDHPKGDR